MRRSSRAWWPAMVLLIVCMAIAAGVLLVGSFSEVPTTTDPLPDESVLVAGDWGPVSQGVRCRLLLAECPLLPSLRWAPGIRLHIECHNTSQQPLRLSFYPPRKFHAGHNFEFILEKGGDREPLMWDAMVFYPEEKEALIRAGGYARITVTLPGLQKELIDHWHRNGVLLKVKLLPGFGEHYWQGEATSAGIQFPPVRSDTGAPSSESAPSK